MPENRFTQITRSMKFPYLISSTLCKTAIILIIAGGSTHDVHGQISTLKKAVEGQESSASPAAETTDDMRVRITRWYDEAKEALEKLEVPGSVPADITPDELEERRRILEGTALIATQWLKNIETAATLHNTTETGSAGDSMWTGFKETPPYSILLVDELKNERDAIQAKLDSYQATLTNYTHLVNGSIVDAKAAEDAVSARMVDLQRSGNAGQAAASWRLEAARENSRKMAARSGLYQSDADNLVHLIAAATTELQLTNQKVKVATANYHFSDEDFVKLRKIAAERKQTLHREAAEIAKRLSVAISQLDEAQASLDSLTSPSAGEAKPEDLDLAKFRVEVIQGRVDSLRTIAGWYDGLPQLEDVTLDAYKNRRAYLDAKSPQERLEAITSLNWILDRIKAWDTVLSNEISTSEADLSQLESRATSITAEDPRFPFLDQQRATKTEKLALTRRISQTINSQQQLFSRWIDEFSPQNRKSGFAEKLSIMVIQTRAAVKELWSFEVMNFKDEVVVDGQTITGKIPVTLGMLLRALLFFAIGYWISLRIARRVQNTLVSKGRIEVAQSNTLRNWVMILVSVFLGLGTLAFLRIPLTVFAFFGGALAIGLGFGLQTLIKNFISGIIVLVERKVRVGDVLDVQGLIGTVTEINTRSSIIRSPDEVETMIPNSMFLENQVTNRTLSSKEMRRTLQVGVAYGTSPGKVMDLLKESAERHGLVLKSPEPFVVFDDFGDSALLFSLYFWLEQKPSINPMIVTSDLRLMIEKRFSEAKVAFPFPQRDVHLMSGKPLQVQWAAQAEPEAAPEK